MKEEVKEAKKKKPTDKNEDGAMSGLRQVEELIKTVIDRNMYVLVSPTEVQFFRRGLFPHTLIGHLLISFLI